MIFARLVGFLVAVPVCRDHLVLLNNCVVFGAPCLDALEDLRRSIGGESSDTVCEFEPSKESV